MYSFSYKVILLLDQHAIYSEIIAQFNQDVNFLACYSMAENSYTSYTNLLHYCGFFANYFLLMFPTKIMIYFKSKLNTQAPSVLGKYSQTMNDHRMYVVV